MSAAYLITVAVIAIIVLLLLVTLLKWPAYIALLAVAIVTALVTGIAPQDVMPLIIGGMGSTLGNVALLVGLGTMLGGILEKSGAAAVLAEGFRKKLGEKRVGIALLLASSLVAIPIFYDVAFIILVPIVYSFAKAAGYKNPLYIGLPVAPFMVYLHNTLPPHPGISAAALSIEGDIGIVLLTGLAVGIFVGAVALYVGRFLATRVKTITPEVEAKFNELSTIAVDIVPASGSKPAHERKNYLHVPAGPVGTPKMWEVALTILLPILLIAVGTVSSLLLPDNHPILNYTSFLGAPAFSLLLATVLGYYLLGVKYGRKGAAVTEIMEDALGPAAVIVFVTGAGGVFAAVLTETGIGKAISEALLSTGMHILPLAFLLAAAFKVSQGSGTVAAQTTGGILAATIVAGDYSALQVALIVVAIGAGSNSLSHINDSAFWITTKYLGLSVADGLKTWSVMGLTLSLASFAVTSVAWIALT